MGEESRTKKTRTKRSVIPNAKKIQEKIKKIKRDRKPGITFAQKKKLKKEEEAKKSNGGLYNTEFGKEGMVLKNTTTTAQNGKKMKLGPMEIRYRALAKILRQIEQLEQKQVNNEEFKFDNQQLKKLKRKEFVQEEMRQLIKEANGDDDDDEEEEDDDEEDDEEDEEEEDEEEFSSDDEEEEDE